MFEIPTLLVLIPALPLAAAVLGRPLLAGRSHLPVVVALAISFLASLVLLGRVQQGCGSLEDQAAFERTVTLWNWASVGGAGEFSIDVTLRADPLSAVMLAVVTFIAMVVAVYSIGYMRGDRGYWRFFAYLGFFVFSMTMLVSVSNFLLLYVFWEAVGLSSYLLIGFWYERPAAAAAGKKAFLVNRVGDFGLALGVFLLWTTQGTLDFHDVLAEPGRLAVGGTATPIALLLLLGACGKSAQFPLHVWLPDAMEGPSPVSALIHAATMVTAGVYLVARSAPLFAASPEARQVVAVVGGLTALLGALIALTQTDLKRILAYSTISQLGYMFLALGTGTALGVAAAMFHLFTHAFFKALLFLAAGSVMHATGGVIDIERLGGLRRRLPVTYWAFLVGALALAGVFPLAGFWSKDAILVALGTSAAGEGGRLFLALYLAALAAAGLTAFYTFRAFFLTFHGPERLPQVARDHLHESPRVMTGPLVVLAVLAVLVGGAVELAGGWAEFLGKTPSIACLDAMTGAGCHAHAGRGQVDDSDTTAGVPRLAGPTVLPAPVVPSSSEPRQRRSERSEESPGLSRSFASLRMTHTGGTWNYWPLLDKPAVAPNDAALPAELQPHAVSHLAVAVLSSTIVLLGIGLAAVLYLGRRTAANALATFMNVVGLYQLSRGKFFLDEIYQGLFVRPAVGLARACDWLDQHGIDRLVDFCGGLPGMLGAALRPLQNGLLQFYALAMLLGLLVLFGAMMM